MISLIIAEDQNMLRQAMIQLIKLHGDFEILADVDNGLDAIKIIEAHHPDVVILDIEMFIHFHSLTITLYHAIAFQNIEICRYGY